MIVIFIHLIIMKKLLISLFLLLPTYLQAQWSDQEIKKYSNLMFNTAMKYRTYDNIMSIPESIKTIECIRSFYEINYSYNEWENMFYSGPADKVEEFEKVSDLCINYTINNRINRKQSFM